MRLAEIANELRVTTQELRHELAKTNFGISPTAHEVEDNLAKGIIRFLKGKVKPTLAHKRVTAVFGKDKKEVVVPQKPKATRKKEGKEGAKTEEQSESQVPVAGEPVTEEEKPKKNESGLNRVVFRPAPVILESRPRGEVPKSAPVLGRGQGPHVSVSRRIEVAKGPASRSGDLPHTYYKSKGRRKGPPRAEEKILTMMRHPHTTQRVKKAKMDVDAGTEGVSVEELTIERQIEKERFRAQKKQRTVVRRGPKAQPQIKTKEGVIDIPAAISVKEFSEKCGLPVTEVIAELLKSGIFANINQIIDFDTAAIVASSLGMEVKLERKEATSEELFSGDLKSLLKEEDPSVLRPRPPIVTVMGHVDHGKTKLLDCIRKTNVAAGESGGITQHIGAYQVEKNGHLITFLDTPGHEAFTSMRARGAKVTDIAILVVAADEGVMPQTVEALNHAKEAGVPVIVALNKVDKPAADLNRVKGQLAEHGLQAEDWGGKTIMTPVSALKGDGVDHLLEMILLAAEMENLRANPNRLAVGTIVETRLDPSMGPVATVLVNTGTLRVGDVALAGTVLGKIKSMQDHRGQAVEEIPPSGAARISGLNSVPKAGDIIQAFKNERTAKQRLGQILELQRGKEGDFKGSMTERLIGQISSGEMKYLKIVLKADVKGSLEAILQALSKIKTEDVAVKIIHYGVGNFTGTDVMMAAASQALLIGFHVEAGTHVKKLAGMEHVDIRMYTVIYKLIEDIKAFLSGMLEPEIRTVDIGKAEVRQIFLDKKAWAIAGCEVTSGKVQRDSMARITRAGQLLFEAQIESLKHVKEDVRELEKGSECGIKIKTPRPLQPGDVLEVFRIEKKERALV